MPRSADKSTALWVLKRLRRSGHTALLAGGCVRDMLLGLRPTDYDIATDATPPQVRRLFSHVLLVGARFGVAVVVHRGRHVEVATFRSDVSYSDGRRPDAVTFSTPRDDALRRDFTINGMFHDPIADEVIDYVGGRKDLKSGIIRAIGRPGDRFAEDYLRLIRAVRFAARFGFSIDPATASAVRKHATKIASVSGERICDELSKMLSRPSAGKGLELCHSLGLARAMLPELFARPARWDQAAERVAAMAADKDAVLAIGSLLAGLEPATIRDIVRRWGAPNALRDASCFFARHLSGWTVAGDLPLCDFKRLLAAEHYSRLRKLWRFEERRKTGGDALCRRIARRANGIRPDRIAPPPLVTGADLLAMGLQQGPKLGRILRTLYDDQLNEHLRSRPAAMRKAREIVLQQEG